MEKDPGTRQRKNNNEQVTVLISVWPTESIAKLCITKPIWQSKNSNWRHCGVPLSLSLARSPISVLVHKLGIGSQK